MSPEAAVLGVDFSGGATAGDAIWVARGRRGAGRRLEVASCRPARDLPAGARSRDEALAALRGVLRAAGSGTLIGMDFPFALPAPLMTALFPSADWAAFLDEFAGRFLDEHAFRDACRKAVDGRELRRRTDREARTPFSPYNLRLYRQTYFGLRDVLAPLVAAGAIVCPPMQPWAADLPAVIEVCPASTLKAMRDVAGNPLTRPYKGRGEDRTAARRKILAALEGSRRVRVASERLRRAVIDNVGGDALDSVIAAAAASAHHSCVRRGRPADALASIEGRVYV